ncbi:hypothetical protein TNCT_205951 [Trichonephila clavata]|uniref:Uncharacterized protein n=1 Tax=Trichonephila clavata TaxID=2740835 RepID=A0A8X6L5Y6_TRICU|nr:hypothetical protein TNCT_205951 [Trichonephila clavata]
MFILQLISTSKTTISRTIYAFGIHYKTHPILRSDATRRYNPSLTPVYNLCRPSNKTYLNYSPSPIVRPTASFTLCYCDKIRGQYLLERVIRDPCYEIVIDDYDQRYVAPGMGYWMSGNGVVGEWLPSIVGRGS